jgi:acyl carrier protein
MVPAAFVRLDQFPLTPNGKLDRPALPAPDAQALVTRDYEAPRGEVEATLAEIWQQLLRVDRVGRQDHFFELGGSSLLATQAMVRLRQALDVELPLIQLFQTPVLADLAEVVVLTVVQRFAQGDIEAASADLGDLTDDEIEALLRQERALSQAGPDPVA